MRLDRYRVMEMMDEQGFRTQQELAERIGVSRQTISGWLNGVTLTLDNLGALCEALECTPNDVLTTKPIPKVDAPDGLVVV